MDIDQDQDETSIDPIVLALAAHPLNSCNPPPREMPDLFDSVIASEARLNLLIAKYDKVACEIDQRLANIKERLQQLRAKNGHCTKTHVQGEREIGPSRKHLIFQAEERVLRKMYLQLAFLHYNFATKFRRLAVMTVQAHHDLFDEFLGQKHDHAGIEVANATKLSCATNCSWYQKHGPYEWSKKPYSDQWWEEMNHTDWDWIRIKDHIVAAVSVGSARLFAMYDTLHATARKFVPSWIWAEDFRTWTIHGDVESFRNIEGRTEQKIVIKARFNKSTAAMEQEKAKKLDEIKKMRLARGEVDGQELKQSLDKIVVDVDKIAEMVIDQGLVFDGMGQVPGSKGQGPQSARWLVWWGFEKWCSENYGKPAMPVDGQKAKKCGEGAKGNSA